MLSVVWLHRNSTAGENSSRTDNADQSNSNKHIRLTNVNSHQSGAEDLAGSGRGGRDEGRPRRGAKVATRARRAARPVSCKALIAVPRGCGWHCLLLFVWVNQRRALAVWGTVRGQQPHVAKRRRKKRTPWSVSAHMLHQRGEADVSAKPTHTISIEFFLQRFFYCLYDSRIVLDILKSNEICWNVPLVIANFIGFNY